MVSASWLRRKSSNLSACEPRAPRWTSEINKVRKRRSGLPSLTASLPMNAALTDSHDKGMTGRGTAEGGIQAVLAQPCGANQTFTLVGGDSSPLQQSGDKVRISKTGGNDGSAHGRGRH